MAFVDSVGTGFFLAGSAVFFTRGLGLTPEQVGVGFAISSIVGVALIVPLGMLCDRFDARRTLVAMHVWRGVWTAALPFAATFPLFVVFSAVQTIGEYGAVPASRTVVSVVAGENRVRVAAYMRSWRNIGFTVGAALTAPLLLLDTWWAYAAIAFANGIAYVVAALVVARMTVSAPGRPAAAERRRTGISLPRALSDWPYVALTAYVSVFLMHSSLLMIGLPLWVAERTAVPAAFISAMVIMNALVAASLQVRFSDVGTTSDGARRAYVRAGIALALCCGLVAVTTETSSLGGMVVLVVAVLALTAGEMWEAAGTWTLSYGFAPADREGEYMSVAGLAPVIESVLGSILVTSVVIANGAIGWVAMAGLFLVLAAMARPLQAWLERSSVVARARRATAPGEELVAVDAPAAPPSA